MPDALLTAEAINYYYYHAVEFVEEQILQPARTIMGDIQMTTQQKELLAGVAANKRVAIESGHGTGKSCALSWVGIWFMVTRYNTLGRLVKVPCIAPTQHQLFDVLWPEFYRWIPLSRVKDLFVLQATKIYIPVFRDGKEMNNQCFAEARSPKDADNLQGFHADHLLWVCDEAFGITNEASWTMIEGSLTSKAVAEHLRDNRIIIGGQHSLVTGYCHDAFGKDKAAWFQMRFNSEKSEIADPEFAKRIARKYNHESDIYRVRVLGMAPKGNPEAWITLEQVYQAIIRVVKPNMRDRLSIGVDTARFGDDSTVVTLVKGYKVYPQDIRGKTDTDTIVMMVLQRLRKYRKTSGDEGLCVVNVDATGGFGSGVADELYKNVDDNIKVNEVHFTGKINDEEYYDGVSKMWGELRDQIDLLDLPDDDFLVEELASRKFDITKGLDKTKISSKAEFKTEFHSSPDRADSLVLAIAEKAIRIKVWDNFSLDACQGNFIIDFERLSEHSTLVCGMWVHKSLETSVLLALWNAKTKKLHIFEEGMYESPRAELVAIDIGLKVRQLSRGVMRNLDKFETFGSKLMFSKEMGKDIQAAWRRLGAHVRENTGYNEFGSIMMVNRLLSRNGISLHSRCGRLGKEMANWVVDRNKPADGHGLCRALCVVISVLQETGRFEPTTKPMKPYSRESQEFGKFANNAMKLGIYEDIADEQFQDMELPETSKYGWM